MEKQFIVFYQHREYGYYSTNIEAKTIDVALKDFLLHWSFVRVYGIMEVR
jgi:hypothetical protein